MTIAPAFTIGLKGRPERSSTSIELNASPVGSTPTRASTPSRPWCSSAMPKMSAFEIDWMVKGCSASPAAFIAPSAVATAIPNSSGSARPSSGM